MKQIDGKDFLFDDDVTLLSTSSARPTLREVWRPVQANDESRSSPHQTTTQTKSFRWKLLALNIFGMAYYFFFGNLVFLVGLFVTFPFSFSSDDQSLRFIQVIMSFFYINMMLNYVLIVVYADNLCSSRKRHLLPKHGPTSYAPFCDVCKEKIPARGKHCILCDTCVLKRDHHCFFAGCCIGFHNQRYFIVFCFYVVLGSFLNVWTNFQYLSITYSDPFSGQWYKYLLPWCFIQWMFGYVNGVTLCMLTLTYFTTMTGSGCAFFLIQQLFVIYRGQTSYEYSKGVKIYRTFPADHFRSVFGFFWFLNFLIPMPWFKNIGDGRRWNTLKHV